MVAFTIFANFIFNIFHIFGIHINTADGAEKMIFIIIAIIAGFAIKGVIRDIGIISRNS